MTVTGPTFIALQVRDPPRGQVLRDTRDTVTRPAGLQHLREDYRKRTAGARSAGQLGLLIDEGRVPTLV